MALFSILEWLGCVSFGSATSTPLPHPRRAPAPADGGRCGSCPDVRGHLRARPRPALRLRGRPPLEPGSPERMAQLDGGSRRLDDQRPALGRAPPGRRGPARRDARCRGGRPAHRCPEHARARDAARQLAHQRTGQGAAHGSRSADPQRQARLRHAGSTGRLRAPAARTGRTRHRGDPAARESLGDRRSPWQGWPRPHRRCPALG